jgi:hypothetical protein
VEARGARDYVQGTVVDFDWTDQGSGPYLVWTLSEASGREVYLHAFHDMVKKKIARARLQRGDEVRVTYIGRGGEGGKKVTDPYIYSVVTVGVDRRPAAPDSYESPDGPAVEEPRSDIPSDDFSDIPIDMGVGPVTAPEEPEEEDVPAF